MSKELQVKSLRLKYGSKFVVFTLTSGEEGLLDLGVNVPSSGLEKESFHKLSREISKFVYSGNRSKKAIKRKLNRMSRVENSVLKFMFKVVDEALSLEA